MLMVFGAPRGLGSRKWCPVLQHTALRHSTLGNAYRPDSEKSAGAAAATSHISR
jgi:hypothetical protein